MQIQINKVLTDQKYSTKYYPNKATNWSIPVDADNEDVLDHLALGKAIKFGIQTNSELENENESVRYADGTFIDIDDIGEDDYNTAITDPLSRHAFLIHHSSSSHPDTFPASIHLVFQFDSRVEGWEAVTEINRKLYSYYKTLFPDLKKGKIDAGCYNANRFSYGNTNLAKDGYVIYQSEHKINIEEIKQIEDILTAPVDDNNDADTTLESSQNKTRKRGRPKKDKSVNAETNDKANAETNDKKKKSRSKKDKEDDDDQASEDKYTVDEVIDNIRKYVYPEGTDWTDPDQVFCAYDHEFESRSSNKSGAFQYDGYDPRIDEPKEGRSKSFAVTFFPKDDLWIWRSRAKDKGGNLPEYWYRVGTQDFEEPTSKYQWWLGVRRIYQHFNKLDLYNEHYPLTIEKLPTPHKLISEWHDYQYTYEKYEVDNGTIWLYDRHLEYWEDANLDLIKCKFSCWINDRFNNGNVFILPRPYYDLLEKSYKLVHKSDHVPKFEEDINLYPFSNGLYNTKTKVMVSYNQKFYNVFKSPYKWSMNYNEPTELYDYLSIALDDSKGVQPLVDCMILTLHRMLHLTGKAVRCQGQSGSGKSTVARIISKLLNPNHSSETFSLEHLCNTAFYKTYPSLLHNKPLIWFEDVTKGVSNPENFKILCDGNRSLTKPTIFLGSDRKNIQGKFNAVCNGQVWITSERNIWASKGTSEGEIRREYLFLFSNVSERANKLANILSTHEWLNNFLNWALAQDPLDSWYRLEDETWMNEVKKLNQIDGNVVYKFIISQIEWTDDINDCVTANELYNFWQTWLTHEHDRRSNFISKTKFTQDFQRYLKDEHKFDKNDKSYYHRMETKNVYKRFRIRSLNDSLDMESVKVALANVN